MSNGMSAKGGSALGGKKTIIIIVGILVIIIGGYFIFSGGKSNNMKDLEKNLSGEQMGILSWLTSGKGVECEIDSLDGKIVIQAKNNKIRINGMGFVAPTADNQEDKGVYINDGEWIYMWNGKEGTKMNIESMKRLSGEEDLSEDDYSWQDWAEGWEKDQFNYDCKEKNLSDDIFFAPGDVDFKNLTEMMENLGEMNKKLEENLDAGKTMSIEDVMGQFQNMNQEDIESQLEDMGIDSLKTNLQIEE